MDTPGAPVPFDAPPRALPGLDGADDLLARDYDSLVGEFGTRFGKGEYHAGALFRSLYKRGVADPGALPEFAANPALAGKVRAAYRFRLPPVVRRAGDATAYKFLLALGGGLESESVVIPMRQYKSLCVSSQVGCKMGCDFCETAQMGWLRNLTAGEIVAQVMAARFALGEPVENVVFMGMGEPMDNLDNVLQTIRVICDPRGLAIPQGSVTISTVGHVDGLRRLAALRAAGTPEGFARVRLAVSLNAPNDAVRSRIMPVNRTWDMAALKAALAEFPLHRKDDFLFMEYVLIPGVNDAPEHAAEVAEYLKGLKACVNLIPYNPRHESPYARPLPGAVAEFFRRLMDAGQYCRIRGTKGQDAMAACGQLGNRALRRGGPRAARGAPASAGPAA